MIYTWAHFLLGVRLWASQSLNPTLNPMFMESMLWTMSILWTCFRAKMLILPVSCVWKEDNVKKLPGCDGVCSSKRKNWYFPVTPNFFPSQLRQIQFEDKVDKEIRVWQQEAHTKRNTVQEGKSVSVFEISIFESYLIVFVYSDMNMYYCIFFSRRIREISWWTSLCSF